MNKTNATSQRSSLKKIYKQYPAAKVIIRLDKNILSETIEDAKTAYGTLCDHHAVVASSPKYIWHAYAVDDTEGLCASVESYTQDTQGTIHQHIHEVHFLDTSITY